MSTIKSPRGDTLPLLVDVSSLTDDLTGSTFFITVKKNLTDTDTNAILKQSHLCTNNDNFYFTFPHSETEGVVPDTQYFADVQRVGPGGTDPVETWPTFHFKFSADVTIGIT